MKVCGEGGSKMPPSAGYDERLQHCCMNAKRCGLGCAMRNGHIEAIQLREQKGGFRAECRRDVSNALHVVGILDFEHIGEFSAGKINALLSGAETCIVHHCWSGHAGYHFSRIRIQDIKLGSRAISHITPMTLQSSLDRAETFCSHTLPTHINPP